MRSWEVWFNEFLSLLGREEVALLLSIFAVELCYLGEDHDGQRQFRVEFGDKRTQGRFNCSKARSFIQELSLIEESSPIDSRR